jgi:predicted helicase
VKFLRYGQHFIEKNGSGILAFINPHGFLDSPTFRGMRWNLLKTYDKIYTVDLHGNSKKKEFAMDGSADTNVFDIMQGVSINIFVKTGKKKTNALGKYFIFDLLGKREIKYKFLIENTLNNIPFTELNPFAPNYLFKFQNEKLHSDYNNGFSLLQLFPMNIGGFTTHRDNFAIDFKSNEIKYRSLDLIDTKIDDLTIKNKYVISDNRDWQLSKARKEIQSDKNWVDKIIQCSYRPFDNRSCYFSYVMMDYPRKELIQHSFNRDNLLLGIGRQGLAVGDIEWCLATISKIPVDANIFRRGGVNLFPIYFYPESNEQYSNSLTISRIPNLNKEIVKQIADKLGLTFTNEKETAPNTFAPIDILDYIYAVLHSPAYREKYKEFLKIDFPRVPYPKDQNTFWQLVKLGGEIRQIHLLESAIVEKYITQYPIDGNNEVSKIKFEGNRVYINETQYFEHVPEIEWNFYIGGYQPAQKWLKDRKGRVLDFDDILHYQKIIVALNETDRLMKEVDKVGVE